MDNKDTVFYIQLRSRSVINCEVVFMILEIFLYLLSKLFTYLV